MDYSITLSTDGMFIILKVKGSFTRKTILQPILEAHALGRELQVRRYLSDMTEARNADTDTGNYKFAYQDMQKMEGIDKLARVAILVSPNDHSHDFAETVALNAGLNVRLFTNPDEAKRFLINDTFPNSPATVEG